MALMIHSGMAATYLDSIQPVEHWDLAGVSLGEMLNLNGQYWQVVSISGRDVIVSRIFPTTATSYMSTSTHYGTYLSNTMRVSVPTVKLPPPPGPPADLEPPPWPLWLRPTPLDLDSPPPLCLEIPAVGDLIFHPQYRGGERIDPLTRLTPSETAKWEAGLREAKKRLATVEIAQQAERQSRWRRFWRRRVA